MGAVLPLLEHPLHRRTCLLIERESERERHRQTETERERDRAIFQLDLNLIVAGRTLRGNTAPIQHDRIQIEPNQNALATSVTLKGTSDGAGVGVQHAVRALRLHRRHRPCKFIPASIHHEYDSPPGRGSG